MDCFSCRFCEPDDVDPETLNFTFWCNRYDKEVDPTSYCFDFKLKDFYYV